MYQDKKALLMRPEGNLWVVWETHDTDRRRGVTRHRPDDALDAMLANLKKA